MNDGVSKSWFCVMNNPLEHGYSGEPSDIAEKIADDWCKNDPTRTCAVAACISAEGLFHCHTVFESVKAMRFSAVKKIFPTMHIEPTKGNKEQAENYIQKKGSFKEKGEQVLYIARRGEIKAAQGQRRDLDIIQDLIEQGNTPKEIMNMNISYRRYEKLIRDAYFAKRSSEIPYNRDVCVFWHLGESGSGKSYESVKLIEKYGEDNFYMLSDYENGGFDKYCGEPVLFMDEFRGQIPYSTLLTILQGYKQQIHARYTNIIPLWTEVHITSVLPPEKVYQKMVRDNQDLDTLKQLFRRISFIVYHWKDDSGYHSFELPMSEYIDYNDLKRRATMKYPIIVSEPKITIVDGVEVPF